jgi:hypothetical protein
MASSGRSVGNSWLPLDECDELRFHEIQLFENSVSSFPYKKVTCAISPYKRPWRFRIAEEFTSFAPEILEDKQPIGKENDYAI